VALASEALASEAAAAMLELAAASVALASAAVVGGSVVPELAADMAAIERQVSDDAMHQWLPSSVQQVLEPSHEIVPQHVRPGGAQWPSQQTQPGEQWLVIWEPAHSTRPEGADAAPVVVALASVAPVSEATTAGQASDDAMHHWRPSSAQQVLEPSQVLEPQHTLPGGAQWPSSQQSQSRAQLLVIWEPTHTPSAPTRPEGAAVVVVAFVSARLEAASVRTSSSRRRRVLRGSRLEFASARGSRLEFASAASRPTMPERCAIARSGPEDHDLSPKIAHVAAPNRSALIAASLRTRRWCHGSGCGFGSTASPSLARSASMSEPLGMVPVVAAMGDIWGPVRWAKGSAVLILAP